MRYIERTAVPGRTILFRAYLAVFELLDILEHNSDPKILDIGGGEGVHARFFREHGYQTDVLDLSPAKLADQHSSEEVALIGNYEDIDVKDKYDVIWASHVLEHTRNPGIFIDKLFSDLKEGGWACVTVPPLREKMTFVHPILWNPGSLLINFILSGFWCREAHVSNYSYNSTIIVKKDTSKKWKNPKDALPSVEFDGGYFKGAIRFLNWNIKSIPKAYMKYNLENMPTYDVGKLIEGDKMNESFFFRAFDVEANRVRIYYFDTSMGYAMGCA